MVTPRVPPILFDGPDPGFLHVYVYTYTCIFRIETCSAFHLHFLSTSIFYVFTGADAQWGSATNVSPWMNALYVSLRAPVARTLRASEFSKIPKNRQKWGKEAYIYAFLTIFHDFSLIFHCCPSPTHPGPSPPRTLRSDHPPPSDRALLHTTITTSNLSKNVKSTDIHPPTIHPHPPKTLQNPRTPHPPPLYYYINP